MNSENKIKPFLSSLALGLIAGFISLMLASVLELLFSQEKLSTVFLFVLLEESLKFGAIYALVQYGLFSPNKTTSIFMIGLGVGAGFSVFEGILIFLKLGGVPIEVIRPATVHIMTSILLALSMKSVKKEGRFSPAPLPILFAVIIHLCYNIFVMIGI